METASGNTTFSRKSWTEKLNGMCVIHIYTQSCLDTLDTPHSGGPALMIVCMHAAVAILYEHFNYIVRQ